MKECKGCKERYPACQDSCERLQKQKQKEAAVKEKIHAAKEKEALAVNTAVKLTQKRRRKYAK